jgi:predicted acetyltransferase
MVVLVGLGMFLVFFLHLRSVELNVWGAEKFWKIPEYMIYYLSGVWLIDGTIMGVIFISNRAHSSLIDV